MKNRKINLLVILLISFLNLFCSGPKGMNEYNTVVKYSKSEKLQFPDFKLEFTGTRDEKKEFPNGNSLNFRFYDFVVSNDKTQKNISWSSGTGDIAPLDFEFDGKKYQLELSNSEKLKTKLGNTELVIVKK